MQGAKFRNEEYYEVVIVSVLCAVVLLIAYLYKDKLYRWIRHRHGA
jgi:hypothetical protein